MAWTIAAAVAASTKPGQDVTPAAVKDALPAASTSDIVKQHGILDLALTADGAATSTGVLATFDKDGRIVAVGDA